MTMQQQASNGLVTMRQGARRRHSRRSPTATQVAARFILDWKAQQRLLRRDTPGAQRRLLVVEARIDDALYFFERLQPTSRADAAAVAVVLDAVVEGEDQSEIENYPQLLTALVASQPLM